jgi:L-threonylcarbamoyladenylate synthase
MPQAPQILRCGTPVATAAAIRRAVAAIKRGKLVAFPTETVYGLGADAFNRRAVRAVFKAKGRPADNPLIVHVASLAQARQLVAHFPSAAARLAKQFTPGPLTFVLKHRGNLPREVTAGLDTVAVRVPDQPVTLKLLRALRCPLVGPSANLSGRPSPTTAQHVADDLGAKVAIILDGGQTRIGLESTVLDFTTEPPTILRQGAVTPEQIERVIGRTARPRGAAQARRSPGTRHRHYSPRARVELVAEADATGFVRAVRRRISQGKTVAALVHSKALRAAARRVSTEATVQTLPSAMTGIARELFGRLRELDKARPDIILVEKVKPVGLGLAVVDRLERAAAAGKSGAAKKTSGAGSPKIRHPHCH